MLIAVAAIFVLALAAPLFHRLVGDRVGWALALPVLAVGAWFASYVGAVAEGETFRDEFPWAPQLNLAVSFHLDGLSLLMALLILGIGALVTVYTGGYLHGHPMRGVFYAWLMLFMGSMLGLTLADNVIALYVFWELTTISSFLLIGFEHEQKKARDAAWQALLVTAGGGLALLAALLMLAQAGGSYELTALRENADAVRSHALYPAILVLVLIGAFTKSAQFPFHFWLPAAMEAPTPASAYLHSATMVKAGVYLLARLLPVLGGTAAWLWGIAPFAAVTMLLSAWLALNGRDLKQILAYSTITMLGWMMLLLAVGTEKAAAGALAMLLAHALYKGALFLVAGSVDHEAGTRELDRLSGLGRKMPLTATAAVLAAISMAGILPAFGFIAKETAFEAAHKHEHAAIELVVLALASMLMVAVAALLAVRPYFGAATSEVKHAHEAPPSMWLPALVLAAGGFAFGLAPQKLAQPILGPSIHALGFAEATEFKLWHGFTFALALSLGTLTAGILIYAAHRPIGKLFAWPTRLLEKLGPAGYDAFLGALTAFARLQTRVLQSGYLRHYVVITVAATIGLLAVALVRAIPVYEAPERFEARIHEAVLAAVIVMAAALTVFLRSRLAAVAALGVVGYAVAGVFVMFGAPDLAMTQFVIETLTVIVLVLVLFHLPRMRKRSSKSARMRDALIAGAAGCAITVLLLFAVSVRTHGAVSDYYAEHAYPEGHGRNIVNVILVDFRALDTLGEITVLAIAGVGVYGLLKLRLHRERVAPSRAEGDETRTVRGESRHPDIEHPRGPAHDGSRAS